MSTFIQKCCGSLFKAALIGTVIATFGASTPAMAVNPGTAGVWELDGNTTDDGIHDWNDLYPTIPAGLLDSTATTGIAVDIVNNLFTQGSKDTQDVSKWSYTVQSAPPKADIRAAYAIRYTVSGDEVIYFGSDRGTTNGTTFSGYWFFQDNIQLGPNGKFIGQHKQGDVLVAAAYDNGGHVGSIVIFQWAGGDGTNGHLQQMFSISNPINQQGLLCNLAKNGVDTVCGETNGTSLNGTIPWRSGDLPAGVFFEGGIDFTALFNGTVPCFASFLATTRSSTSPTAEIKNFVLHGFGACGFNVTKSCLKPDGTTTCVLNAGTGQNTCTISGQVNNTGGAPLTVALTDQIISGTATDNGDLSFVDCTSGTPTGSATATVAGNSSACYRGTFTTDASGTPFSDRITATSNVSQLAPETATATCSPLTGNTGLFNAKACTAALVAENDVLDVVVSITGTVRNVGNIDLHNVTVTDVPATTITMAAPVDCTTNVATGDSGGTSIYLKAGACATYSGSYRPSSLGSGSCGAFSDTTTATALDPSNVQVGQTIDSTPTATCSLCPLGGTGTCPAL